MEGDIILAHSSIIELVNAFWAIIFNSNRGSYILIQLRIKTSHNYYSLSKIQSVSFKDKAKLTNVLTESLDLLYERYTQFPIQDLFIRYTILPNGSSLSKTNLQALTLDTSYYDSLTTINLPATLDLNKWGKVTKLNDSLTRPPPLVHICRGGGG